MMIQEFTLNWNITTYEVTEMGGQQGEKKVHWSQGPVFLLRKKFKFYIGGAESSK